MITKEHLIEILNIAHDSPEKVEIQEHFGLAFMTEKDIALTIINNTPKN